MRQFVKPPCWCFSSHWVFLWLCHTRGVEYCNDHVHLSAHISQKPHCSDLFPVAVARSSLVIVVMHYVFPTFIVVVVLVTLPPAGERHIVMSMSVCLSVWAHLSSHTNFTESSVHGASGYGTVILRQCCNQSYISGFMVNVMFTHSGPYGEGDTSRL